MMNPLIRAQNPPLSTKTTIAIVGEWQARSEVKIDPMERRIHGVKTMPEGVVVFHLRTHQEMEMLQQHPQEGLWHSKTSLWSDSSKLGKISTENTHPLSLQLQRILMPPPQEKLARVHQHDANARKSAATTRKSSFAAKLIGSRRLEGGEQPMKNSLQITRLGQG